MHNIACILYNIRSRFLCLLGDSHSKHSQERQRKISCSNKDQTHISVKPFSINYDSQFTQQGGPPCPGRQKTKKDSLFFIFRFTIHSTRRSPWPRQTEEVDAAEWCWCVQVHILYIIYKGLSIYYVIRDRGGGVSPIY